jgi:hypothetical protein
VLPVPDQGPRLEVPSSFDALFKSDGAEVILKPIRAPQAKAFAERWVRTVRTECLDWMLVHGRGTSSECSVSTSSITTAKDRIEAPV